MLPACDMSGSDRLTDRATRACRGQAVGAHVCAVSSLGRYVGVMTSETLARAGTLGGLVVLEARMGRGEEVWRAAGVHSTDINPVPALHAGEKPQYSNDFRWVLRRQAR